MQLDALLAFYENLTPAALGRFREFYSEDAVFKDPFNEVCGVAAIERIFAHMFRQVQSPRFKIIEVMAQENQAMLVWRFDFRLAIPSRHISLQGVSHLKFAADGRVCLHRDYWDAAEELYMQLTLIGGLMRLLQNHLRA